MTILGHKLYRFAEPVKRHTIKNHWIRDVKHCVSPHYDERPDEQDISLLVIHCISLPEGCYGTPYIEKLFTQGLSQQEGDYFAPLTGLRVSSHLLIRRDGTIEQYVPFDKRAWHAGVSSYDGRERCNDFSIGIELEGTDHSPYSKRQYQSLVDVSQTILDYYPKLTLDRITGHQHIAPGRKTDPGHCFDWSYYLNALSRKDSL
ncbi:1,6-anhydro-N-acetylmuramyl-L-alanine amidase AmpD [Idiomarina sp.]|uniref:1,6-anhydro-N-acetylmuramyl-L-alanine amidase AmpD n=1 Tax=Idiomarina sp. TaxID=1874361 RepID=UPI0025856894|nr:1,6-anhydro-N-acetylmuramyl-L-alanine amidase AmpD [Idiomarina sp.]